MGILGIENRTENWRTASVLSPLVEKPSARVSLASRLVGSAERLGDDIEFELFWRGMRDYVKNLGEGRYMDRMDQKGIFEYYVRCFGDLREKIERFYGFRGLDPHNYVADNEYKNKLYSNLLHTEVDIVLQTSQHLCIGEAKCGQSLGANSKHVLVHQLVRQYVMAKILVKLKGGNEKVVPFVVGDCRDKLFKTSQVKFMIEMSYLSDKNVLSWKGLREIIGTGKTNLCGQDLESSRA